MFCASKTAQKLLLSFFDCWAKVIRLIYILKVNRMVEAIEVPAAEDAGSVAALFAAYFFMP